MKKFLLYGHSGSYNHGSEAIASCTISHIRENYPDAYIILSSHFPDQDREFSICADKITAPDFDLWQKEKAAKEAAEKYVLAERMYANALDEIDSKTTLLSIGGDNFCYGNSHRLAVFQNRAKEKNAKSILWYCSLDEKITDEVKEILLTFNEIIARESLTYNLLKSEGFNNIKLDNDIAFRLKPKETDIPQGSYIILNLSPLLVRKNPQVIAAAEKAIEYILSNTDLSIALLPHVVNAVDNDMEILSQFAGINEDRIIKISDKLSAAEYKYIITKSKGVISARTHACIAAYSTNIPVLALGYSQKALGIAIDNNAEDLVVDCRKDISVESIADKITWL
jgi:polysaccharide pyruvyl transferase WcaK-like protein